MFFYGVGQAAQGEAFGFVRTDDSLYEGFVFGLADPGEEVVGGAGMQPFGELAVVLESMVGDDYLRGARRLTAPSQARAACLEEIEEETMMKVSTATKA